MNVLDHRGRAPGAQLDLVGIARRSVVAIAAGAGLIGILAERPVLSVAWRAGAVALIGLGAIALAERALARSRSSAPRGARGGTR